MTSAAPPTIAQRRALQRRPQRRPVMRQGWRELLFLHWSVDPEQIRRTLPPGLHIDTFEGRAWLGIVPFFMRDVRPRGLPAVPGVSNFQELNLRTYVHDGRGISGVWFYALDANQRLAVHIARAWFCLPYRHARMSHRVEDGAIDYRSRRRGAGAAYESRFRYRGEGPTRLAEPGSLEFFLVERYVLFARTRRGLASGRVHHDPYRLRACAVDAWSDALFELEGFGRPGRDPDHAVLSPGVDVEVFALEPHAAG